MEALHLILLLHFLLGVFSYPNGPPQDACSNATPQHPAYDPIDPEIEMCPYLVDFESFTPGELHILNITSWTGNTTFKGYQLTIFNMNSQPVGVFSERERTICDGAAATHSEGSEKLYTEVEWMPPQNSSGETYFIWLTIVKTYSEFWINCDPIIITAADVPPFEITTEEYFIQEDTNAPETTAVPQSDEVTTADIPTVQTTRSNAPPTVTSVITVPEIDEEQTTLPPEIEATTASLPAITTTLPEEPISQEPTATQGPTTTSSTTTTQEPSSTQEPTSTESSSKDPAIFRNPPSASGTDNENENDSSTNKLSATILLLMSIFHFIRS